MATYTKETALYDTGAIKDGIDEAATTATNYITYVDAEHGIRVCDGNTENVNVNYAQINSDGMSVYKDSGEVATFGLETRIGSEESANFKLSTDGMSGSNTDGDTFFNVDYDSGEKTTRAFFSHDYSKSKLESKNGLPDATDTYKIDEWTKTFTSDSGTITLPQTQNEILLFSSLDYSGVEYSGYVYDGGTSSFRSYIWNAPITLTYGTSSTVTKTLLVTYASSRKIGVRQVISFDGTTLSVTTYACYYLANTNKRVIVSIKGNYYKTVKAPSFVLGTTDGNKQGLFSCAIGENITNTGDNQLAVGKNNESKSNAAFIIGNGTSDTNRSNAYAVDWDGKRYANGYEIGEVISANATVNITSTNVDTYFQGASLTLPAGTYLLIGTGTFASNATETNRRVLLYNNTGSTALRVTSYWGRYWCTYQTMFPLVISSSTTVSVRLSAGVAISGCSTIINAIRIA